MTAPWWKTGVIYQIYPRSFMDSDGDGLGDLDGIRHRLDHLAATGLGVDAIWLGPIHPSPDADFGYDVADFDAVDPRMGGEPAFDRLLEAARGRGLRVLMDLVVNHTSDQHAWFQASRARRDDKDDWYFWRGVPPNNWASAFGGSGWRRDPVRGEHYLHTFLPQQPDLNWRHPPVADEIVAMMRRWVARGVSGFRLDVFNCYVKDASLRSNPRTWNPAGFLYPYIGQRHIHDRDQEDLLPVLARMREAVGEDGVLLGETLDEDPRYRLAAGYCGPDRLHLAMGFELLRARWGAARYGRAIRRWAALCSWPTWVLANHDFPRSPTHRHADTRARLDALILLTLRGTPIIYYGQEIGMVHARLARRHLRDPLGLRFWPLYRGRDGARTPMQWEPGGAGFSAGTPWLPISRDGRSVAEQTGRPGSVLETWKAMLALRRTEPALQLGGMTLPERDHAQVLTWRRDHEGRSLRTLVNLSARKATIELPEPVGETLLSTHDRELGPGPGLTLGPLEGAVVVVG